MLLNLSQVTSILDYLEKNQQSLQQYVTELELYTVEHRYLELWIRCLREANFNWKQT